MCGICGIMAPPGQEAPAAAVQDMVRALAHRGPDAQETYAAGRVAVGHTRLSIIDLEASRQPMVDAARDMVLVFNGEIYNYRALRRELEAMGHGFLTSGDTEVLLRAYQAWGEACVERLDGMFAFVVIAEGGRSVFAARDRLGIKPLHYHLGADGRFAFASELAALMADPALERILDPEGWAYYFQFGYAPDPLTLLRDARSLPPAHTLVLRDGRPTLRRYWSFVVGASRGEAISPIDAAPEFERRLALAVEAHRIADVPVGSFLSGGLDSSIITTLAARSQPLHSYTVGMWNDEADERPDARAVAAACGSEHHEIPIEAGTFEVGWIDRLLDAFGQPHFDTSAIPTWLLCQAVRRHVKVALSGDGGDELFAGYRGHSHLMALQRLRWLPTALLGAGARVANGFGSGWPAARRWGVGLGLAARDEMSMVIAHRRLFDPGDLLRLFPGAAGAPFREPAWTAAERFREVMRPAQAHGLLSMTLQLDTEVTLPADILAKVDRMSMAHGLEVRPPLLDHRLVEFAAALPDACKAVGRRRKILLREIGGRILPSEVLDRPKRGFSIHLRQWLNGAFFALARDLARQADDVDRGLLLDQIETCERRPGDVYLGGGRGALSVRLWMIVLYLRWRARFGVRR